MRTWDKFERPQNRVLSVLCVLAVWSTGPPRINYDTSMVAVGKKGGSAVPSPSMIASLSAAIAKSPRAFTAVILGCVGTVKCFPGGYA